jgi:UDP-2-acetamido-3-amino-2,3-dideoxy-glucuronate N-acetyltransferase
MRHLVDAGERLGERVGLAEVGGAELARRVERRVARERDAVVPRARQLLDHQAAEEAGPADDSDPHGCAAPRVDDAPTRIPFSVREGTGLSSRRARQGARLFATLAAMSFYRHETACVDDGAAVGEGSEVWHYCHVSSGARVGRGCVLGQNVYVGPGVVVGDGCRVQNNVSLYEGVLLEEAVFVGPSAVFTNVLYPRAEVSRRGAFQVTRVRRGATIGANATVLCGVEVGSYALVGAGAVVVEDVPAHALAVGVPARRVGWACRCGVPLALDGAAATCSACGRAYRAEGDALCEP